MDPTGTIADAAAVGAVLGATGALIGNKETLTELTATGMVIGGFFGGLRALLQVLT